MDKFSVKQILVTYIPPLDQSQAEAIAAEIAKISAKELESVIGSAKKSVSRSRRKKVTS